MRYLFLFFPLHAVTFLDRTCVKDVTIGNIKFQKGVNIGFPIWAIHRFHENFEKPLEFMPERFLKPMKDKINPYAYIPFGGGPRKCIGKNFRSAALKKYDQFALSTSCKETESKG